MQAFLRHIFRPANRIRHSRGFGIHSPFAFRFVTEVLCQPLPYYGYAAIGRDRRLRLLFRLMAEFRPRHVLLLSSSSEALRKTVATASPHASISTKSDGRQPDLIVADDLDCEPADYLPMVGQGSHALVLNASKASAKAIRKQLKHGMLFDNGHGTIVIAAHRHLPRQNFEVKF